jgi:hypothetical protein
MQRRVLAPFDTPLTSVVPFEFRSGPFCQGHRFPSSSVDPRRIVCPRQFASPQLAAFPRPTGCQSRIAYRPQRVFQRLISSHRRPSSCLRWLPRLIPNAAAYLILRSSDPGGRRVLGRLSWRPLSFQTRRAMSLIGTKRTTHPYPRLSAFGPKQTKVNFNWRRFVGF